jgi:hypothetical protein
LKREAVHRCFVGAGGPIGMAHAQAFLPVPFKS